MSAAAIDPWLGEFAPAARIGRPPINERERRGRSRKTLCPECGFIAYVTAGGVERAGGLPSCACGARMTVPNLRDRAAIEWDTLETELLAMGRHAYIEAMGELGFESADVVGPATVKRKGGGLARIRCQWPSCGKFTNGRRYCPEHDPFAQRDGHYADRRGV
jgi:hypothetical protein